MTDLDYRDAQIVSLAARVRELEEREATTEGRFQALVQSLDVGVIVLLANQQITLCNPAARELLGGRVGSLAGCSDDDARSGATNPSGVPLLGCDALLREATTRKRPVRDVIVTASQDSDAAPRRLLVCIIPQHDDKGDLTQVIVTLTDVSLCHKLTN
ncbi:MAG TPA: PAS domain-containing protein [Pseudomonadota bacterium]|jgi:PAS domain-containing protein|nr:PAS domain-containing protein [Pseudomonadota bacterium]HNF97343.1 PAS domain-containing protein [Pseudomonadota bacterium]HNI61026.1 PAS domain-containing protein [Pseudomonadota bacterium]HNK45035.1 PAS domain-containing protein [Pseudomonadota bacterium]HNN50794.1 PAS domain-containing protein [Pseudomonadota bacterium]